MVAVACSAAPEGHTRWTLQLLADQALKLELTGSISRETVRRETVRRETVRRETVRRVLKKTNSSRGGKGVVHPKGERRVRSLHGGCAGPLRGTPMRNPMTPSGP